MSWSVRPDEKLPLLSETTTQSGQRIAPEPAEARDLAQQQVALIVQHWKEVCEEAHVTRTDRALLAGRQFLNPYSVDGLNMNGIALS